jgi:hypothetical protein
MPPITIIKQYTPYLPSLILTASAKTGNVPLKFGPRLQLFRFRRWLSNAGLISHWSSSLGSAVLDSGRLTGVPAGWGVWGPAGLPALTWVEKGLDAGMEEVVERVLEWILEAGRRQSRAS